MTQAWDSKWENVFSSREWGKYPDLEVVRFMARNFYKRSPRSEVKVLEVGCGTGANIWYMAREGFQVTGVDGSQTALDILRQRLNAENLNANLHQGDICQLPFADQTFDAVIDCGCLCCNSKTNTKGILDEVRRVLKVGGRFFSLTFTPNTWGHGTGQSVEGEAHTFLNATEGPLVNLGLIRFTSEEDLQELYGSRFELLGLETVHRTSDARSHCIEDWVITCARTTE